MSKTKVQFLIHPKDEDKTVFAFFPEIKFTNIRNNTALSYEHIGQHSECSFNYAMECVQATKSEYTYLFNELTNLVGYELKVLNKL